MSAQLREDLAWWTAQELVEGYAGGTVTPLEATEAALSRIAETDAALHAFVLVDADQARAQAGAATDRWNRGEPLSPVDGVPASVKDIFLSRGWPTLRGSLLVDAEGPWTEDAPAVARLREAGTVLLGKTTTPEFAWKGVTDSRRHGATGNPWDPALTAGGSSGGSAAAVGAGMGPWSIGTDGGGSVRIPASFTGTVALKATYGRVPHWPASPYGTLAHAGPMARTVGDTALLLDVLSGFDPRDWSALAPPSGSFLTGIEDGVAGLRVGYAPTLGSLGHNDPEVEQAVSRAVGVLADAGAQVVEVDPELGDPDPMRTAFEVLWFTGAGKVLAPYGPDALEVADPGLAEQVRAHAGDSARDYLDATAVRMEMGRRMGLFHAPEEAGGRGFDVLVSPTMPIAAFPAGQDAPDGWPTPLWTTWCCYTWPFNMTQQPALSVPCGTTADGRPIGLQVVGPRHADALVLRVGRAHERATDWHTRRPPVMEGAR